MTTDEDPTAAISVGNAAAAAAIPVEDEASSLRGLGGYHGSIHPTSKVTIYYAIGVFSETRPSGSDNGSSRSISHGKTSLRRFITS